MSIKENIDFINDKIRAAEIKSGREPGSVKLMAVSKFNPKEAVEEAINAGQFLFGENRVQEACEKFTDLLQQNSDVKLHIIGSLQTNKVKNAVKVAQCIQSVDRIDLLNEIEKQCSKLNKTIEVLFELHTGEDSKAGFDTKEELEEAVKLCSEGKYPHIIPKGLMTMAPFTEDKTLIRNSFRTLKEFSLELKEKYTNLKLTELSMGMSGDFEIAIEEGSTIVRVGTAIFGERNYNK